MTATREVEFFSCVCGASNYLAWLRLTETAQRTGASIHLRPVDCAALGTLPGALPSALQPARHGDAAAGVDASLAAAAAAYAVRDLQDWARFCGTKLVPQPPALRDAGSALRALLVAGSMANDSNRSRSFGLALLQARHVQGRDIGTRDLLLQIAADCGMPATEFAARLDAADLQRQLDENVVELRRRGGFCAPTMLTAGGMFVGHERITLLEMTLMRTSDRPFIAPGEHDRA